MYEIEFGLNKREITVVVDDIEGRVSEVTDT